ncbi:MAG TPA: lanthionine synthetase C family protein [Flavitalea sp.]|nr:lanthionine synthetase C family protein [Flavitalea sp.]
MINTTSDGMSLLVDVNPSLVSQIEVIAEQILKNKDDVIEVGLLGGKAGITLLFAYLSKAFPEKKYLQATLDYLDELSDSLSTEELSHNMSAGVAGIAFVFQHLRNIGILDNEDDLNLLDLDEFIAQGVEHDFSTGNWDPLHGITGLGIYFLERNTETGEKKYLEKIVDHLTEMRTEVGEYKVWITPGFGKYSNDNYNLGLAHGMPGVLSFLAQVYSRGIRQNEIESIISSSLPFLLKHEYVDEIYCFPTAIDVLPKEEKEQNSRLAWCYGDLCMAFAIIHCGIALQNDGWLNKGIEVALKTTHRTLENSDCNDAPFCHGTVGLLHLYHRLYSLTKNETFKSASQKWLDISLHEFYKPGEGAGGYFSRSFNEEKNNFELIPKYSLLEGSAGIALVYLSYLYDINPDWDIIFLTNV